ncbi:MAG: hypothetical protein KIS92_18375 [Planctomycetota bacterium]|nr:hypothetical protein [Planctomycetota bacterium]
MLMIKEDSQRGPKIEGETLHRVQGFGSIKEGSPTARGWVLGLASVALLCKIVPMTDYVLQGTRLTLNVLPFTSVFLLLLLILAYNALIAVFKTPLGLTRQDLALIFCMTMVANHIPGHGFLSYLTAEIGGVHYYATPENHWGKWVTPFINPSLTPHDPLDPNSTDPRPIEWLWTGLPDGRSIPWGAWAGPYGLWSLMMLMLYGMMFAACALLRRQWADHEKLPFPLAQIPTEMLSGLEAQAGDRTSTGPASFMRDKLAWFGMGLVFLLHSWNAMSNFNGNWPSIELRNESFGYRYLTEAPLSYLNPVWIVIYPSIIGLTYLVSAEIGFSLWFFFVVLKLGVLFAVFKGAGASHNDFMYSSVGLNGIFINQGVGALFAMVLSGVWMARGPLKHSFLQAIGSEPTPENADDEGLGPRALWLLLIGCFAGSAAWLSWAGVGLVYALFAVFCVLVMVTGVARLVSEGGIFYTQVLTSPVELSILAAPPAVMGAQTLVPLSMWSRITVFDYYRLSPMVTLMTAIQAGSTSGLRRRPLAVGLVLAILLSMGLGFFTFFDTVYHAPGGANNAGWVLSAYPRGEFRQIAERTAATDYYLKKKAELEKDGKTMPESEVPTVARRDWTSISWLTVGMLVMFLFVFIRTRIFWWPHPIGYVVWAGPRAINLMWFSFLLGWLIKTAVVRFGGMRVYLSLRRFFLGMVIGEAVAALFWIALMWAMDKPGGYYMHFN